MAALYFARYTCRQLKEKKKRERKKALISGKTALAIKSSPFTNIAFTITHLVSYPSIIHTILLIHLDIQIHSK